MNTRGSGEPEPEEGGDAVGWAGRVALVAGATGGIGRVVVERLAAAGLDVALTYLDRADVLDDLRRVVMSHGRVAFDAGPAELSDPSAARAAVERTRSRFGRIDAVVYAAGPYIPLVWLGDLSPQRFRSVIEQDVCGCYNLIHAVLPSLRETRGCLVALTTPAVRRHAKRDTMSSVPKAAIEALVRGVAAEEGRHGVRANCVGVGLIDAGIVHRLQAEGDIDAAYLDAARRHLPLQRMGSALEIAQAVVFLVRADMSGYISGQSLVVDGGFTA